jgi:hypothetical protein
VNKCSFSTEKIITSFVRLTHGTKITFLTIDENSQIGSICFPEIIATQKQLLCTCMYSVRTLEGGRRYIFMDFEVCTAPVQQFPSDATGTPRAVCEPTTADQQS